MDSQAWESEQQDVRHTFQTPHVTELDPVARHAQTREAVQASVAAERPDRDPIGDAPQSAGFRAG